jgi:hypothetical protein
LSSTDFTTAKLCATSLTAKSAKSARCKPNCSGVMV